MSFYVPLPMHWSSSQAFSSTRLFTRGFGRNSRSRRLPTWFSTCPFSQPAAGVHATGTIRWCEHICRKRRLYWRALPMKIASTAVFMFSRVRRYGSSFAVLYLDLDQFKDVNDTLGHPVGDLLLQTVAERLRASVREVDTVARFGGDEFAILLNNIGEPANAALVSRRILDAVNGLAAVEEEMAVIAAGVAEKIIRGVNEPIAIQTNLVHTGASIGIAVSGPDASDAEILLSHADVALYRAKTEQRGTYRFFTDGMDCEVRARVNLTMELRAAIAEEQFLLMYQPQVDRSDRRA
jgi:diguanylate cyclase (GGDEF)-like protein